MFGTGLEVSRSRLSPGRARKVVSTTRDGHTLAVSRSTVRDRVPDPSAARRAPRAARRRSISGNITIFFYSAVLIIMFFNKIFVFSFTQFSLSSFDIFTL